MFARCLSSLKDERTQASRLLKGPPKMAFGGDKGAFLEDIRKVGPGKQAGGGAAGTGTQASPPPCPRDCSPRASVLPRMRPGWPAGRPPGCRDPAVSWLCLGPLCFQDHLLRPRLHAAEAGGCGVRLDPQLRRHRPHVEGRLYHPQVREGSRGHWATGLGSLELPVTVPLLPVQLPASARLGRQPGMGSASLLGDLDGLAGSCLSPAQTSLLQPSGQ